MIPHSRRISRLWRRLDLARQIAAAQVGLQRVRAHKLRAISPPMSRARLFARNKASRALERAGLRLPPEFLPLLEREPLEGPEEMAAVLDDLTPELIRLDRYERRALSRRKSAIRRFDALAKVKS